MGASSNEACEQSLFYSKLLNETSENIKVFSLRSNSNLPPIPVSKDKQYIYKDSKYILENCSYKLQSQIKDYIDDLQAIKSSVLFLLAKAGQGKTNFVCDFAEKVLARRSIPCIFLTGREMNCVSPDKIGDYIVRSIFGDRYNGNLDNMLVDLDKLSVANHIPIIIIIDGINEHTDICMFAQHLEKLAERILTHNDIRLIMTCRSEYFDQRFSNFLTSSFSEHIYFARDFGHRMSDIHKEHLLGAYFRFFKLKCPYLSEKVEMSLKTDTLLLRIFCEAYGDHNAVNDVVLPQMLDLYKDEIFINYLGRKLDEAANLRNEKSPLTIGKYERYKKALQRIIGLMIEKNQFVNIPISELGEDRDSLAEMIGEDIIFRIDLTESSSVLDEKTEVVNFTFDEFRDFLLADHLACVILKRSSAEFEKITGNLTKPELQVSEGISRFLFYKSKRPEFGYIKPLITSFEWYKEVFAQSIFSTKEVLITDEDLEEIKSLFLQNVKSTKWIFESLTMIRWREDLYPKLNIHLLFRILDELDDTQYKELVVPLFKESYGWRDEDFPIDNIANQIGTILSDNEKMSKCPSIVNLAELLIYLFSISGRISQFPAYDRFYDFALENVDMALDLLKKHSGIRCKSVALKIKNMLSILCRLKEEQ